MKHTKETLAALLNGREIGDEITREEAAEAKASGLVVVYGYSDDNVEFKGAINDEVGAYDGGTIEISRAEPGIVEPWGDEEEKTKIEAMHWLRLTNEGTRAIEALWGKGEYSWQFMTDIPHVTFEVVEGGEKFCRGIIFAIADLTTPAIEQAGDGEG